LQLTVFQLCTLMCVDSIHCIIFPSTIDKTFTIRFNPENSSFYLLRSLFLNKKLYNYYLHPPNNIGSIYAQRGNQLSPGNIIINFIFIGLSGTRGHSTRRKRYSTEGSYACCIRNFLCFVIAIVVGWYYRKMTGFYKFVNLYLTQTNEV
jgi:hypothetical protein